MSQSGLLAWDVVYFGVGIFVTLSADGEAIMPNLYTARGKHPPPAGGGCPLMHNEFIFVVIVE